MNNKKVVWTRLLDFAPVILLISLVIVFAIIDPRIVSSQNLVQILIQAAPICILSIGAMVVLISGGIDLSAGYGVGICSLVFASILTKSQSLIIAFFGALITGIAIGLFNGFFVGLLKIQSFIVTLGSMTIIQGVTLSLATSGVLIITDPLLTSIGIGSTWIFPNILLTSTLIVLLFFIIIRYTSFGVRTYGLGSSIESSESSGVSISRQQILIYIFSGVCTALTAMTLLSRVSVVSPNIGGVSILLDAITATVIGGTSIYGGKGSISGTIVGALIISLISYALTVFGVNSSSLDLFKGGIIILALALDAWIRYSRGKINTKSVPA
nr:ABC transporter permease [Fredinandcohnia onubensis]